MTIIWGLASEVALGNVCTKALRELLHKGAQASLAAHQVWKRGVQSASDLLSPSQEVQLRRLSRFDQQAFDQALATYSSEGGKKVKLEELETVEQRLAFIEASVDLEEKWRLQKFSHLLHAENSRLRGELIVLAQRYLSAKSYGTRELESFARKFYRLVHGDQRQFRDYFRVLSRGGEGDRRLLTERAMNFLGRDIHRILPPRAEEFTFASRLSRRSLHLMGLLALGAISLPAPPLAMLRFSSSHRFPTALMNDLLSQGFNEHTSQLVMEEMSGRLLADKWQNVLLSIAVGLSLTEILFFRILRYTPSGEHRKAQTLGRAEEVAFRVLAETLVEKMIQEGRLNPNNGSQYRKQLADALSYVQNLSDDQVQNLEQYLDGDLMAYNVRDLLSFNLPDKEIDTSSTDRESLRDYLYQQVYSHVIEQSAFANRGDGDEFASQFYSEHKIQELKTKLREKIAALSLRQLEDTTNRYDDFRSFASQFIEQPEEEKETTTEPPIIAPAVDDRDDDEAFP